MGETLLCVFLFGAWHHLAVTDEMPRFWVLGAVALVAVALSLALDAVQVAVAVALVVIFLSLVLFLDISQAVFLLILVSPLIQAPSIKLGLRWNLPGLLAWLLAPWALGKLLLMIRGMRPLTAAALAAFAFYVLYTTVIGLVEFVTLPAPNPLLLEQFGSPVLRLALEGARLVGVLAAGVSFIWVLKTPAAMRRALVLFAYSGVAVAIYGIYQTIGQVSALPLPVLPGTLTQGGTRPFSTFFEPTGFGSFLAVSLICAVYVWRSRAIGRGWGVLGLFLIICALLLSTARAGMAAAAIGLVILLVAERGSFANRVYFGLLGLFVLATLRIMFLLFGEDQTRFAFSPHVILGKITDRLADVMEALAIIAAQPLGIGQGLYVFLGLGGQGAARVISESGVIGLILLGVLHAAVIASLAVLRRDQSRSALMPYLAGAYGAAAVASLNYFNLADLWIWIPLWLPIALAQGQAEDLAREHSARVPDRTERDSARMASLPSEIGPRPSDPAR